MFVVGLAGGLAGAAFLSGGEGPALGSEPATSGSPERGIKALEERILALESSAESQRLAYDELDGRLMSLSRRPDLEQLLASADAGQSPNALNYADLPVGQAFDAAVDAAIQQREDKQRAEREAEQAKRREERALAMAERVSTELNLDPSQSKVVQAAILEASIARESMFTDMRNGDWGQMDREAIGKKMTELREAEIAKVSAVLSPAQVEQYSSLTNFGGGGRGFGGDAGGGRTRGNAGGGQGESAPAAGNRPF